MTNTHRRILLVDDDENLLRAAHLRLSHAGFETEFAMDGRAGVEQVQRHKPDAIVLDVKMPRTDGLTALAELQSDADTMSIPVVMVSASVRDQQRALEAGARYFLSKPYDGKVLLATIEKVLETQPAMDADDDIST